MLNNYRRIRGIYGNNERIKEAALFIKYDYSPNETLYEGETIPGKKKKRIIKKSHKIINQKLLKYNRRNNL